MNRANPEQLQAIGFDKGQMMVLAGPGAGKTFVITRRIADLIRSRGIPPESILVITFTKAAALEMQNRFYDLMGDRRYPVCFGTFHAIFYRILQEKYPTQKITVLSEGEKRRILEGICDKYQKEFKKEGWSFPLAAETLNLFLTEMANVKAEKKEETAPLKMDHTLPKSLIQKLLSEYEEMKDQLHRIDFDDMAYGALDILEKDPDTLKRWQERFQYILIDEFQDISPLQYKIVRILAQPEDNLFIVGDDDQSIYGFRGSSPKIMLDLEQHYPEIRKVCLGINYRCSEPVVKGALQLIGHNNERFEKALSAFHEGGSPVVLRTTDTKEETMDNIIKEIKNLHLNTPDIYAKTAILARTSGEFSVFTQKLASAGIPFRVKEKVVCMYETDTAGDLLAYLKLGKSFLSRGCLERKDLIRIWNRPLRYLPRNWLDRNLLKPAELSALWNKNNRQSKELDRLWKDLVKIGGLRPYSAINYVRKGIGYDRYVKETLSDPEEVQRTMELLEELLNSAEPCRNVEEWESRIRERIREYERARLQERRSDLSVSSGGRSEDLIPAVTLMTMHGSKGLEFERVYLPFCVEGEIPHKKSLNRETDIEEERRLFYVAMTRAKRDLILYSHKKAGDKESMISRFISETGIEF